MDSCEFLMTMREHSDFVTCARFSPDGQIVSLCREDRSVIFRYANTRRKSTTRKSPYPNSTT